MVPVKMMVIVMAVATVRYDDAFVCCTPCDACCIMYDDVDDDDGDGDEDDDETVGRGFAFAAPGHELRGTGASLETAQRHR